MQKELDYYESKLQALYTQLENANELVQDLKDSKEHIQTEVEKKEEEKKILLNENKNLHQQVCQNFPKSHSKKHLQRRSMTIPIPLDEIQEKDTPNLSGSDDDFQDPNIEKFLKQINELKAVCQQQGEALVKFQETMESTKEDNDRLQNVLIELENEKKGISDVFGNSELRNSNVFENLPSPVAMRSPDSSLFVSAFEVLDFERIEEKEKEKEKEGNLKVFHRHHLSFVKRSLLQSHISGLKL